MLYAEQVERNLKLGVRDVMKPLPEALERLGSAGGSGLVSPLPSSSAAVAGGNGGPRGSNGGSSAALHPTRSGNADALGPPWTTSAGQGY